MIKGTLIKESLSDELILDLINIEGVEIWVSGNHTKKQPKYWTAIFFSVEDDCFAYELSKNLYDGWYVDLGNKKEKVLVFKEKVIRYIIGDVDGEQNAIDYCREVGIPDSQIDWNH